MTDAPKETHLCATLDEASQAKARVSAEQPNFVTHIFHMALQAVHCGLIPSVHRFQREFLPRCGWLFVSEL